MLTHPFVQHQLGILAFIVAQLLIALSNSRALRRLGDYPPAQSEPHVSVLVPARNEERSIRACVESLLTQSYANMQIVVLDDSSTDRTGEILAELQRGSGLLHVISGEPLQSGWTGKNWACHQLARYAMAGHTDGQLLLFVDADTTLEPTAIADAVAAQVDENADLLSAMPRQELHSWMERLVVPVMPWSIYTLLPFAIAYWMRAPWLSAAVGQFMLFRSDAYSTLGGHSSVRQALVEDIELARRTKAMGLRWRLVDGSDRVHCRMYRSNREVVDGISRTLFAVFRFSLPLFAFAWLWLAIVYLEPVAVVLLLVIGVTLPFPSIWIAVLSIVIAFTLWWITYQRFSIPKRLSLLYPATIVATVGIAARAAFIALTGRGQWKGRSVATGRQR